MTNLTPNHLLGETSPYLLLHLYNPVDWYPYSSEAFTKAQSEGKLIFLSIGYSACHWCHVMEHESFEDESVAQILNESFVSIKVDREERPDLDQTFQYVAQMMQKGGGWPLSIVLTPDAKPFFAGTYFPPTARYGLPGFKEILNKLSELYQTQKDNIDAAGEEISSILQKTFEEEFRSNRNLPQDPNLAFDPQIFTYILETIANEFDNVDGGFGSALKFPNFPILTFAIRQLAEYHVQMPNDAQQTVISPDLISNIQSLIELTLDKMADGGIYDHIGGGFARYSVDKRWLVPHFEKMLYDNAMALVAYSEAYRFFGNPRYKQIVEEIIQWAIREMLSDDQGFYATLDADSAGEEGKFYLWTKAELDNLIAEPDQAIFYTLFEVKPAGNFEGHKIILHRVRSIQEVAIEVGLDEIEIAERLKTIYHDLFEYRQQRVFPHRDEKIITAWNALMVHGFLTAYPLFKGTSFGDQIKALAFQVNHFLENTVLNSADDTLNRITTQGISKLASNLDDYAYFMQALWDEFELTHDFHLVEIIQNLRSIVQKYFWQPRLNDFYYSDIRSKDGPARPIITIDNPLPSPTAVMLENLLQKAAYLEDDAARDQAEHIFQSEFPSAIRHPLEYATYWLALQWYFYGSTDIGVIYSEFVEPLSENISQIQLDDYFVPRLHSFEGIDPDPRLITFTDKAKSESETVYSICLHRICLPPMNDKDQFETLLEQNFIKYK